MNSKLKFGATGRRWIYIVVAIAFLVIVYLLPSPPGLERPGEMGIAILIAGIILWVTEALPLGISAVVVMILMYVFGVAEASEIWENWISSSIFFILAAFGISTAMLKTKIPMKIVLFLLDLTHGNSRGVVFAFMLATWFISMFISDFPSTALMTSIAVTSVLEIEHAEKRKSNLGKCLLIGIPIAAVVGGAAIPTGSAMNIMANGILEGACGISIAFADWIIVCLPISAVLLVSSYVSLIVIFKPESLHRQTLEALQGQKATLGKLGRRDVTFIIILCCTFALWVAGNWLNWDTTIIALGCLAVLFFPGIEQITWKDYKEGVSWQIVLLVGSVSSLAAGIQNHGGGMWLFSCTVGAIATSALAVVVGAAVFLPIVKLIIPTGPAIIALFLVPLTSAGEAFGITPAAFAIMVAVNASNTFLLGLDSNHMMAYRYGYWSFWDFFKAGIFPTIMLMLTHSTILVPMLTLLGY